MPRMSARVISCVANGTLAAMLLSIGPGVAGAKPHKVESHITEAAALTLQRQMFDALSNGDGAAFAKLLADDVVFIHLNGHLQTKAELLSQAASGNRPGKVTFKPFGTQVHFYEGLAVLSGPVDVTETGTAADGTPESHLMHVRLSEVWASRPEGWQVVLLQGTNEPEPKK
jgi:hypothetical protein